MKSSRRKLDLPRPADTRAFFAKYLTSEKVNISMDTCTYSLAVKNVSNVHGQVNISLLWGKELRFFFIQKNLILGFHNDVHQ